MNNASSLGIGILIGLAVGAALGMLLAPKSGAETRAMLKEKAEDAREKAGATVKRVRRGITAGMEAAKTE